MSAIEAALLPSAGALAAWERLRERSNSLDKTDIATFRMLPMVYRNLHAAGLAEAELATLKGIYRQHWLKTRITLRAAGRALDVLDSSGIQPVALKGLGLMAHGYSEAALRPMHDLDFLLEAHAFVPALDALLAAGWKPLRGSRASYLRRLKVFHALPVIGPDGVEIDLHRYMLEENCYPGADAPVFGRTRPGMAADLQITTLGAEDQIINSCVHGVRWDPVPPLRWALDAVMVVRDAGDSLDWDYLVQEARRRRVSLGVGAALDFVSRFEPSIPSQVVERLLEAPCGWLERWDFRFQQGGYSAPVQIGRYITRYLRLSAHRGPLRRAREFPTYLEAMWQLDSPRQVPADGAKRVWKAIRR